MEAVPSQQYQFVTHWRMNVQRFLQSTSVWKSVVDGYTPPKKIKTAAQKEAQRSNALALKIIQRNLSEAMKNEMKSITLAKEVWLKLE